tara:strand:+ start:2382 stop:3077 length:696 start_codon:yes stop_codon:yes gene_type:complete
MDEKENHTKTPIQRTLKVVALILGCLPFLLLLWVFRPRMIIIENSTEYAIEGLVFKVEGHPTDIPPLKPKQKHIIWRLWRSGSFKIAEKNGAKIALCDYLYLPGLKTTGFVSRHVRLYALVKTKKQSLYATIERFLEYEEQPFEICLPFPLAGKKGPKVIAQVRKKIFDKDPKVRESVAKFLGAFSGFSSKAVKDLKKLSNDPVPSVAKAAKWALRQITSKTYLKPLPFLK